jgi:hypothetical protein
MHVICLHFTAQYIVYLFQNTPSIPKCLTLDFFYINIDHSSYLKYFKHIKNSNI